MSWSEWAMCKQKKSDGVSLQDEMACLGCLITKNQPELGLKRAGRFIHHLQWEHRIIHHVQWEYRVVKKELRICTRMSCSSVCVIVHHLHESTLPV